MHGMLDNSVANLSKRSHSKKACTYNTLKTLKGNQYTKQNSWKITSKGLFTLQHTGN